MNQVRITAEQAGYLELRGAKKDGDCQTVAVDGGISKGLGCCNNFGPEAADTNKFSCGTCQYLDDGEQGEQADETRPLGKKEARGLSFKQILDSQRPILEGEE